MASGSLPETDAVTGLRVARGCQALGLSTSPAQEEALEHYVGLLGKWNRAYNLTAIRQADQMVIRHLLDSLAIVPHITGERLIDVGTGAGLPGVPLAIVFPDKEWHLLDSNGKKTRFLFQVKTALGLDNMVIHHARVESFRAEIPYDAILSRAFASLQDMIEGCRHLLSHTGCFLAMKGMYPADELEALRSKSMVASVHELAVPGLDEARHLVQITPQVASA